MIVRLMGEGQWQIDDGVQTRLNELDEKAMAAIDREDEEELDRALEEMWDLVQTEGKAVPAQELAASDVIIPPSDLTLEETRQLFADEGLIPDLPV